MRDNKFRAWDKEKKIMLYPEDNAGFEFGILYDGTLVVYRIGSRRRLLPLEYTGLKDKRNREIYEGDIVKGYDHKTNPNGHFVDDVIGIIKYQGLAFSVQGKQIKKKEDWFYTITSDFKQDRAIEVIGNIYENSLLLKETK